ncbi:MAG: sigma-70 family RNA polymerase sigma factor [Bacilli bacterium]|nr:sigma-70 family RNA polymerase sigma factor [Bacilli bacterium]
MISENNEDAYSLMIEKYQPLVKKYAERYMYKYKNYGIELDELIQEGTIGLINAINSYMNQDKCIFYTFANLIIKREMDRYVKKTLRNKHLILSTAISMSESIGVDDLILEETIYHENNLVEFYLEDEYYSKLLYKFKYELSDLQSMIYELRLNSFSNKEISILLDITYKNVDNSIRLIKNKFKNYIQSKI